jgi:hypothetical protein
VYSDITVFPEDTIFDLRLKLCAAAGVPLWRAHLFYYVGVDSGGATTSEGPVLPYRVTLDGVPVPIDWRALGAPTGTRQVAGVAVDLTMEARHDGLRVEALDTFTLLAPLAAQSPMRVTRAYYVDLAALPFDRAALGVALRDRYQFDLLYYSAIVKYWPQLSPDAAARALGALAGSGDAGAIAETYPALAPDATALLARFAAERALGGAARAWRPAATRGRSAVAVTAASLRVAPAAARVRVATRNVFDWVATGAGAGAVLAARTRFDGPTGPLTASKRHSASFIGAAAVAVDTFIGRLTRRYATAFALARTARDASAATQIATLTVGPDGRYDVAAEWREDDRVSFEDIHSELAQVTAPVLKTINRMGAAAFPIGGELASGIGTKTSGALGQITASVFWPHALSAAAFRDLKASFREYEVAGAIGIRGLQLSGTFQFAFRRGIVAYDRRQIGADTTNQYSWLTDADAAARWATMFGGRTVRIIHRATDLQVEIARADSLAEFNLIVGYLFAHLDEVGRAAKTVSVSAPAPSSKAIRRLRRLQERDPQLFDLKRHAPESTVYSVICQAGRQPHVYDAAEAATLAPRRREGLTKYWNYTTKEPAFYECPNPHYAHLSFRAGVHPLGYCLPCCKKSRAAVGSRAAATNRECLKLGGPNKNADVSANVSANVSADVSADVSANVSADADTDAGARHVLAYGKVLAPGRLGALPRILSEGLFLGILGGASKTSCMIIGIEQEAPAVPNAGFAFALARALAGAAGLGGSRSGADKALGRLADAAVGLGDLYMCLGGGAAAALESAAALGDAIRAAFVRREPTPSPFSPGGSLAAAWPDLLTDLARAAFGLEVVVAFDPAGSGAIALEATGAAAAALEGGANFVMLLAGPNGAYPMALMPSARADAVANVWSFGASGNSASAAIAATVSAAIASAARPHGRHSAADMALLTRFLAATPEWTLETRVANLHDNVYAAVICRGGERAYIPLAYSPANASTKIGAGRPLPIVYGPRPAGRLPVAALDAAVAAINAFIATGEAAAPYATRANSKALTVNPEGAIIGYLDRIVGTRRHSGNSVLYFYHDAIHDAIHNAIHDAIHDATAPHGAHAPHKISFPYDPREVDEAIMAMRYGRESAAARAAAEARAEMVARAAARHRIYPLLQAEFSAALARERNAPLRRAIAKAITETHFATPRSVAALRDQLSRLLDRWPDDNTAVRSVIARAYADAGSSLRTVGARANAIIAESAFAFDHLTLTRLRALPSHSETVAAVREILGPRIELTDKSTDKSDSVANMFVACGEPSDLPRPQCHNGRLAISDAADFFDVLAADIRNPGKVSLLGAASAGVIDPQEFIRRPGEILKVQVANY